MTESSNKPSHNLCNQLLTLISRIIVEETPRGVPQGSPLSPLLANIMLDDLDRFLESKNIGIKKKEAA